MHFQLLFMHWLVLLCVVGHCFRSQFLLRCAFGRLCSLCAPPTHPAFPLAWFVAFVTLQYTTKRVQPKTSIRSWRQQKDVDVRSTLAASRTCIIKRQMYAKQHNPTAGWQIRYTFSLYILSAHKIDAILRSHLLAYRNRHRRAMRISEINGIDCK